MMIQKWILPCNVNIYDIIHHFSQSNMLFWGTTSSTKIGDEVYIYVGKPYSEIMYKCHIAELDVSEEIINNSDVAFLTKKKNRKKFARIEMDKKYPDKYLPYSDLINHGLVSVQSQMPVSKELADYLDFKG